LTSNAEQAGQLLAIADAEARTAAGRRRALLTAATALGTTSSVRGARQALADFRASGGPADVIAGALALISELEGTP
jgi:hypothetical protein